MTLLPNTIKPSRNSGKKSKRLGRGNSSGAGNYSGRGMKGQRARSGGKGGLKMKGFKGILQSTPKLRGFKSLKNKPEEVKIGELEKNYSEGDSVNLDSLLKKGLIDDKSNGAKIIFDGAELKKKLSVEGIKCTKNAEEAVKKAGGEVK